MVQLLWCILQSFAQQSAASRSILPEEAPLLHKKKKNELVLHVSRLPEARSICHQGSESSNPA